MSRTGLKTRILPSPNADTTKTGTWKISTLFYDDKGRKIYTVANDVTANAIVHSEYSSTQFDFGDRDLIAKQVTSNVNAIDGTTQHTELVKSEYEPLTGNLVNTKHKIDGGNWTILNTITYDDLGRVKQKTQGNNGEVQEMSYNIRGLLTGINELYAATGNKQGASRTFGESIFYDYGFSQRRHDNKIAGVIWRGSGASYISGTTLSRMYAYGYRYDQSGRIKAADFRMQENLGQTSSPWTNSAADYSISNLFYDKNGNILSINQRGVDPGNGPVNMDVMSYNYMPNSNQLQYVNDNGVADYGAGDFQNLNTGNDDYAYDSCGNLAKDLNKGILAVKYTFFNKPYLISFQNGKSIEFSYDAAGNKVQELIIPGGSGTVRTDYIGNEVYKNDSIQYMITAEGRAVFQPQNTIPVKDEFFVKDHLGNVRSTIDVVTYQTLKYLASYEVASANLEGLIFDNLNEIRDDKPDSNDPNDLKSGRLNGSEPDHRVGTSLFMKVMAGDKVDLKVNNYYESFNPDDDSPVSSQDMLSSIISTLVGGAGGLGSSESHDTKLVERILDPGNYAAFQSLQDNVTDPSKPKAYLNYIFFDQNSKVVPELSGSFQANGNQTWASIGTNYPIEIPVNGYMAIYISNASGNVSCGNCGSVFFDQLWVEVSKGNLLEETHYYPHGLPISNLGSTTVDFKTNRKKYQGKDYIKDLNLNWMDFAARQYDPQIGRFLSIDPRADEGGQEMYSPYAAMGNAPEGKIDPNGEMPDDFVTLTRPNSGFSDDMPGNDMMISNAMGAAGSSDGTIQTSGGGGGAEKGNYATFWIRFAAIFDAVHSYATFHEDGGDLVSNNLRIKTDKGIVHTKYRFHFIFESETPTIYRNTVSVLLAHPEWYILTYNGGGTLRDKNREQALLKVKGVKKEIGFSWDEFPYASTFEGGAGSYVFATPVREQQIQAGQLGAMVSRNPRMQAGDKILVIPIAKQRVVQPVPAPMQRQKPSEKPIFPILVPIFEKIPTLRPTLAPIIMPLIFSEQVYPYNGRPDNLPEIM